MLRQMLEHLTFPHNNESSGNHTTVSRNITVTRKGGLRGNLSQCILSPH